MNLMCRKERQPVSLGRLVRCVLGVCCVVVLLVGCRKRVPEPWVSMGLPLYESRVASGTSPSAQELMLSYTTKKTPTQMCATFLRKLQQAGFIIRDGQLAKKPDIKLEGKMKMRIRCKREGETILVHLNQL